MRNIPRIFGLGLGLAAAVGLVLIAGTAGAAELTKQQVQSWKAQTADWQRRAQAGSLTKQYTVKTVETFDASGPALVNPRPGDLLIYENTGTGGHAARSPELQNTTKSSVVVVIDAITKEVIASNEMPKELNGNIHTSAVSADSRWVYMTGPTIEVTSGGTATAVPTLLKVDALTLKPVKTMRVGGRLHHANVWQDKYMLMDTFSRDADGLDVFIFDPATDTVIGGIRDEELGGSTYTAFGGPNGEYIYILMEPSQVSFADPESPTYTTSAHRAAGYFRRDRGKVKSDYRWIPPHWVAKVKASNWEVVREYPYPAWRSDWVQLSGDGKSMYVDGSGDDKVVKIDLASGDVVWSNATDVGPYAIEVNADSSEVWIVNKGEAVDGFGRTITVIGDKDGKTTDTIPSLFHVDHVVLSPDGTEMWISSNNGELAVFDAASHERIKTIPLPGFGRAHGMVFVYYDENGGRVVADQGDFHGGVDPRNGKPLSRGYRQASN